MGRSSWSAWAGAVVAMLLWLLANAALAQTGAVVRVGPSGDAVTIAEAARLAKDGDTVEVQAGDYRGDVAVWLQKRLTIRAVGGHARLFADGRIAEGKAIWVIRNGEFTIEGFDFVGARARDANGAGIRFEHGRLTLRDSKFLDNQMGILTGNDGASELTIERCEFSGPVDGTHFYHNVYVGRIASFTMTGSWSHDAYTGHLLKSRARENHILYNRLTDEGGNASYELEFPDGGVARVIGNLIAQSARSPNAVIVSFGAEDYFWPVNALAFVHNTVVNLKPGMARFVRVAPGQASAAVLDNLWVGGGVLDLPGSAREAGNVGAALGAFASATAGDYRPLPSGPLRPVAARLPDEWLPTQQYVHERGTTALSHGPLYPGAFQL